jgi:hypothetical protein
MVTDAQVKGLLKFMRQEHNLSRSALKAGMSENTARKCLRRKILPSESKPIHDWQTREDPFEGVWNEVTPFLEGNPGLQAKTVFGHLQRKHPGLFADGQLRTLQRRFGRWRAMNGEGKEVFFPQQHYPGALGASDFTEMSSLRVSILGQLFAHMVYHYVLTYSNWEDATICFSESFESLSAGLQNALWCCGGCPGGHRTDSLTAAVNNLTEDKAFTQRYQGLMSHYRMCGQHTNPNSGNENGDIEQRHRRFRDAADQALMLRGSRDFTSYSEYETFLRALLSQLNSGRAEKFREEQALLQPLPHCRLADYREVPEVAVRNDSTVSILRNIYSVHSRLIGYHVTARVHNEHIELWVGSDKVWNLPRLHGRGQLCIHYRDVIDWLVRKPGAFANYRYQAHLFPTTQFRIAYDMLCAASPAHAAREYLAILYHAAMESEIYVNQALQRIIREGRTPDIETVKALVTALGDADTIKPSEPEVGPVSLSEYDSLISEEAAA